MIISRPVPSLTAARQVPAPSFRRFKIALAQKLSIAQCSAITVLTGFSAAESLHALEPRMKLIDYLCQTRNPVTSRMWLNFDNADDIHNLLNTVGASAVAKELLSGAPEKLPLRAGDHIRVIGGIWSGRTGRFRRGGGSNQSGPLSIVQLDGLVETKAISTHNLIADMRCERCALSYSEIENFCANCGAVLNVQWPAWIFTLHETITFASVKTFLRSWVGLYRGLEVDESRCSFSIHAPNPVALALACSSRVSSYDSKDFHRPLGGPSVVLDSRP